MRMRVIFFIILLCYTFWYASVFVKKINIKQFVRVPLSTETVTTLQLDEKMETSNERVSKYSDAIWILMGKLV